MSARIHSSDAPIVATQEAACAVVIGVDRTDLIREAACEIAQLSSLLADQAEALDDALEPKLSPRLQRTLNQRVYQLSYAVLRLLDADDDPAKVRQLVFPATCMEVEAHHA